MGSLLLAALLTVVPLDTTESVEECRSLGPKRVSPPITSLNQAQQIWFNQEAISRDTLQAHLSRVLRARRCFRNLSTSQRVPPYVENVLETYEAEARLRVSLRQFSDAFAAYDAGLSYLQSLSEPGSEKEAPADHSDLFYKEKREFYQNKGYLHYLLGNLSASIEHYLRAYEAASFPEEQIEQLVNVGILHQRTQDYRSARHYFLRAQERLREDSLSSEENDEMEAFVHMSLADLLLERTLSTEFDRSTIRRARDLARRGRASAKPGTERHARVSSILAESLGYLGAFDAAYRLNEQVRQYARAHDDASLQTYALLKLGVLHVQTERWARADSVLRGALSRAEDLGNLDLQRRILRTLGRLHEMQNDWSKAERFYRQGVAVVEEYRESLTASQWSMTAFAQWREMHRGLTRALLAQDKPRAAFMALERSRARHLEDLRTQARVSNQLSPGGRARFDSLSRALTEVRNRLGESGLSDQKKAALRNREARLMAVRQQLLDIDTVSARPSIDDISATLARQNRVLVSYFLDNPWPVFDRAPRSIAFILTGDTLRTVSLSGFTQDSVQALVESTSPLFTSRGKPNRANAMHFDLRPLHRLYETVYAPVAERLPEGRPLTVIPDGPLFYTPFSMLVRSLPGGRYSPSEARYVLHERPTSLELASFLVADTSRRTFAWSKFNPQMAAYGVSEFDTLQSVPSDLRASIPEALSDSSLSIPSLPGVEQELRALQSTVPSARVALNRRATEASFCRSVRKAGVVHVASHAFVNASSPLRNAILLRSSRSEAGGTGLSSDSTADPSTPSDGVLFLHELQGQRSRIPMVVLSGCNTASGTLRGGEGMEGLQYAFRAMGAQSTLSTLWPVADQASVELMKTFYQNLQDGHPKDVALRRAQLRYLREHPEQASPFFWAPPVLYGSPAPLPLDGPLLPVWAWWALGLGALLVGGLVLWWMRARRPFPHLA